MITALRYPLTERYFKVELLMVLSLTPVKQIIFLETDPLSCGYEIVSRSQLDY